MRRHVCALCRRVGTTGFRDSGGADVCANGSACLRRYRAAQRDADAARQQDDLVLITGRAPVITDGTFAMDISVDYAADRLCWEYRLDDVLHEKVITEMAAEMDDAWFSTADYWVAEHDEWLRSIPTFPRECWCGQWPGLGTNCWYHGHCTCLERTNPGHYRNGPHWQVRAPGRVYGFEDDPTIEMPGGCPVHPVEPGTPVPTEHVRHLRKLLADQHDGNQRPHGGRPATARPSEVHR